MGLATVGYSMPVFWWGLILIMFFSVQLGWTPVSGRIGIEFDPARVTGFMLIDAWLSGEEGAFKSALMHLVLPTLVLGTSTLAVVARMTRSSMLEVLREDYVRTARAKGLGEPAVLLRHVLRNALVPILTHVSVHLPGIFVGSFLIEVFFSIPGLGREVLLAVNRSDYPVIQAITVYLAMLTMVINLLTDVMYKFADPRVVLK